MNEEFEIEDLAPWFVLLIALVGGGLRVFLLEKQGLWLDETISVWLAHFKVSEMLHWIITTDQHPPLYYLLLHFWSTFTGNTPYYVRLLSALFGTATIPIIYLIGQRISDAKVGLAAATLLAISPFNIRMAQEARMYTLLAFNIGVAIYALVRLLTDARVTQPIGSQFREFLPRWRQRFPIQAIETDLAWTAFIVFSAASLLTHNTAIFFPIATNLFVLGLIYVQKRRQSEPSLTLQAPSFTNWAKAQFAIFLLWSPWLLPFIQQARRVYQEFWLPAPGLDTVLQVLRAFFNENTLPASQSLIFWVLYGGVLVLGIIYFRKYFARMLLLVTLFALPFLGELLVSLRRPIFYDRTLIWLTLPVFILLAAGVAQLKYRFLMIIGIGILGINNLFSTGDYYRFTFKEDWSTAAGYVANFAEKDDLILFNANSVQIPFDYYFITYEELYRIQVTKRGVPTDLVESGTLESIMTADDVPALISLLQGHDRVWLVYSHNWYTDPEGLIQQTLDSQMEVTRERQFFGGKVFLYQTP